jgi:hypothetical protein
MDLFDNPMISSAKKALTPEQQDEYKRIGDYMFQTDYEKINGVEAIVNNKPNNGDLALYAAQALKAGGSPADLSDAELDALRLVYGDQWFEQFDISKEDIMKMAKKSSAMNRSQRRQLERMLNKKEKKLNNNR